MADHASGDPFPRSLSESSARQLNISAPLADTLGGDGQTIADRNQTLADADQTGSDGDQTAADGDQAAADDDQAASDRHLAHGGDPQEHGLTRDVRDRSTRRRHEMARARLATAAERDALALDRDLAALGRDQAAAQHDRDGAPHASIRASRGPAALRNLLRNAANRGSAAAARATAVEARARAATDREQAARDRDQAAEDRRRALADSDALIDQLAIPETDQLTGTRTRTAGLADLDREIDRARRTGGSLLVAYVDVVGLKTVNDADGHGAGDRLLQRVVRAMRSHLRPYDLIVRLGGDEFLCVMSGAPISIGCERFAAVRESLAADPEPCEIRVGLAALAPEDTAPDLIRRADAELPTGRRSPSGTR